MIFIDSWIKSLKFSDKRVEYRSEGNPGFVLAVRGNTKTWLYIFTFLREKNVMTLGTYPDVSLAKAKSLYSAAALMKKEGKNPAMAAKEKKRAQNQVVLDSRKEITVAMLIEDYLENYAKKKKRSWREDKRVLNKHIKPELGSYKIKSITKRDIKEIIQGVQRQGKDSMARIILAITRKMFAYACEQDIDNIENNPCLNIKVEASNARERALSGMEIKILWYGLGSARMNDSSKRLIKLNLLTASRHSELRGLRWDEIQDGIAIIPAERMKGRDGKVKAHAIPLTELALEIIGKPNGSDYVFPSPVIDNKPLSTSATTKRLNHLLPSIRIEEFPDETLTNINLHDMRKTVNDWMAKLEISQFDRDRVLAHVDGSVNGKNYTVYDFHKEKKAALLKWERKLKEILGMEASRNVVNLH